VFRLGIALPSIRYLTSQKYFSKLWKSFAGNYGHLCHTHNQQ
jgi:hypothetical protein